MDVVPEGDDWIHEIKLDGYRILCVLDNGSARLLSRNGLDWTDKFPEIAKTVTSLGVNGAIIDGEVVALNPSGVPDFQALQNRLKGTTETPLVYFAFDLAFWEGYDLRRVTLIERKKVLKKLIASFGKGPLRYSDHIAREGSKMLKEACRLGVEGIVSKRADSLYLSKRNLDWIKIKCKRGQEFVIGGFTDPSGSRQSFGSLLVGYYDDSGHLRYAGRVGTGFDDAGLTQPGAKLRKLEIPKSPFVDAPRSRGFHWTRPKLVAEVEFSEMTRDGKLRHPAFKGLRQDKPGREVVLEESSAGRNGKANKISAASFIESPGKRAPSTKPLSNNLVAGVSLTNPDKVFYPDDGVMKRDLALYYEALAEVMLPHVAGRPLMIVRCPEGIGGKCFYQKHLNTTLPPAFRGVEIQEKKTRGTHLVLDDVRGLVSLAQMGVLEVHTWGCRADQIERPDRLIFDLDPSPEVAWDAIAEAAFLLRALLSELDLKSFVKVSGGKGLHVVLPIERRYTWEHRPARLTHWLTQRHGRVWPERSGKGTLYRS